MIIKSRDTWQWSPKVSSEINSVKSELNKLSKAVSAFSEAALSLLSQPKIWKFGAQMSK